MSRASSNRTAEALKPRLVLRVGIVGHRDIRADLRSRIEGAFERALRSLWSHFDQVAERRSESGYSDEEPELRFITGLASGVDQLGAQVAQKVAKARNSNFKLRCPIPCGRDVYERQLERFAVDNLDPKKAFQELVEGKDAVLIELDGHRAFSDTDASCGEDSAGAWSTEHSEWVAHQTVGRFILEQSDVLIAVVEPPHSPEVESARSKGPQPPGRGGSMDTVRRGVAAGIPVVWIDPRRDRDTNRDSGPPDLIRGVYVRDVGGQPILDPDFDGRIEFEALRLLEPFGERFRILREKSAKSGEDRSGDDEVETTERQEERRRLRRNLGQIRGFYRDANWVSWWKRLYVWRLAWDTFYDLARRRAGRTNLAERVKTLVPDVARSVAFFVRGLVYALFTGGNEPLQSDPCEDEKLRQIRGRLFDRFCVVDDYANLYMSVYRGTFLTNFILGALAVLCGLLAHFAHDVDAGGWATGFATTEFAFIAIIGFFYTASRFFARWRDRAVDYRLLAEQLRHKIHLVGLGRLLPFARVPAHYAKASHEETWTSWYFRAVVREFGTPVEPTAAGTGGAVGGLRTQVWNSSYLAGVKQDFEAWLGEQLKYHANLHARYRWMHRNIQSWIIVFFALVLTMALAHAAQWEWLSERWTTAICVVLPAFLGALHGFATQAELEKLAERSEAMKQALKSELDAVDAIEVSPSAGARSESETLPGERVDGLFSTTDPHPDIMPSRYLGEHAVRAARLMLEEVYEWRIIYLGHDTEPV